MAKKTSWRRHAWPWDRWWHDTMRSKTVLASALRFGSQNAGKVHDPKENNKSIWCIFYNQKQHCAPTRHRCYTTVGGWKIRRDIYVFISHKSDFIYYISHTGFFIWHTRHTPNPFMIPFQVPVPNPPPQRYYLHIPQPIFSGHGVSWEARDDHNDHTQRVSFEKVFVASNETKLAVINVTWRGNVVFPFLIMVDHDDSL